MTGELDGTLSGHPVKIDARGNDILVTFGSIAAPWQLRGMQSPVFTTLLKGLRMAGIKLRVQFMSLPSLEVSPDPGALVRFFAPGFVLSEDE